MVVSTIGMFRRKEIVRWSLSNNQIIPLLLPLLLLTPRRDRNVNFPNALDLIDQLTVLDERPTSQLLSRRNEKALGDSGPFYRLDDYATPDIKLFDDAETNDCVYDVCPSP